MVHQQHTGPIAITKQKANVETTAEQLSYITLLLGGSSGHAPCCWLLCAILEEFNVGSLRCYGFLTDPQGLLLAFDMLPCSSIFHFFSSQLNISLLQVLEN